MRTLVLLLFGFFTALSPGQSVKTAKEFAGSSLIADRLVAVSQLDTILGSQACPLLEPLLYDSSPEVRGAAADAMQRAVARLRREAYLAPRNAENEEDSDTATKLNEGLTLYFPYFEMRDFLKPTIEADIAGKSAVKDLVRTFPNLQGKDQPIQNESEVLGSCGTPYQPKDWTAANYLAKRWPKVFLELLDQPGSLSRLFLMRILGNVRCDQALPKLILMLRHGNSRLRWGALYTLQKLSKPELYDAVLPLAQDPCIHVRYEALGALATLDANRALNVLFAALADPSKSVRASASWEISRSAVGGLEKRILAVASAGPVGEASIFLEMMSAHPSELYDSYLKQVLKVGSPNDLIAAVSVFTALPTPSHKTSVMRLRRDSDPSVRSAVAEALRTWNEPASWEVLQDMLSDPSSEVICAACRSLGEMKVTSALAMLERVKSTDPDVLDAVKSAREAILG